MTIQEIYKKLIIEKSEISLSKASTFSYCCPYCREQLLNICVKDEKAVYEIPKKQGYIYFDGDTIYTNDMLHVDAVMCIGECFNCSKNIYGIDISYINKLLSNDKEYCFLVCDKDNLVKKYESVEWFDFKVDNVSVGYLVYYKNVKINSTALCSNVNIDNCESQNLFMLLLECLADESNENLVKEDYGVCNGRYENSAEETLWIQVAQIVAQIVDCLKKIESKGVNSNVENNFL